MNKKEFSIRGLQRSVQSFREMQSMGEGRNTRMHEHIFMHRFLLQMRHFPFREVTQHEKKHHSPLIENLFLAELLA